MKVNNFITVYNVKTKHLKELTPDVIIETVRSLINPISYISYDNKIKIIDKTLEESQESKYPTATRYKHFIINLIAAYTNLEIKEDDFDVLSESKMIDIILSTFKSEYEICSNLMQMCISDLESG